MVTTIQRNDAGQSNWQAWHNAAIASVGFEFNDVSLYNATFYGKSGKNKEPKRWDCIGGPVALL
jgi:hypothetical protein